MTAELAPQLNPQNPPAIPEPVLFKVPTDDGMLLADNGIDYGQYPFNDPPRPADNNVIIFPTVTDEIHNLIRIRERNEREEEDLPPFKTIPVDPYFNDRYFEEDGYVYGPRELAILDGLRPYELYLHERFSEIDKGGLKRAQEAWQIQAKGYKDMGFVDESAIDPKTGYMDDAIDHARGPWVTYNIARNYLGGAATMRTIMIPNYADYKRLPAYEATEQGMDDEGREFLESCHKNGHEIIEIAGLASFPSRDAIGINEIIRRQLYMDMGREKPVNWYFSVVATTHKSFANNWGIANLHPLGQGKGLEDARVKDTVHLVPGVIEPDKFHERLVDALEEERTSSKPRPQIVKRLTRNLAYYTEGLDMSRVSQRVSDAAEGLYLDENE